MNRETIFPANRKNLISDFFDLYAREFFSPMMGEEKAETNMPKVEVNESEKGYFVQAELPGMKEKDIKLTLEDNCLILQGEKKSEHHPEDKSLLRSEFFYGPFYRTIPFRADVDDNKIDATYRDGILSVNLVKKTDGTERTKRIQIKF
jgi:HSP20 family protein